GAADRARGPARLHLWRIADVTHVVPELARRRRPDLVALLAPMLVASQGVADARDVAASVAPRQASVALPLAGARVVRLRSISRIFRTVRGRDRAGARHEFAEPGRFGLGELGARQRGIAFADQPHLALGVVVGGHQR